MSNLFWLSEAQLRRIKLFFAVAWCRVDDRRVVSGIIFVIWNGLRWRDAPAAYGPAKTLYNRFVRWSRGSGCSTVSSLHLLAASANRIA